MTREERAQRWLINYFEQNGHRRRAGALRDGRIISMNNITVAGIMLAFADAEAAAMRERAAKIADAYSEVNFEAAGDSIILDPVISGRGVSEANIAESEKQRLAGMIHTSQAHAGNHIAAAIRALPATGEVGR